MQTHHGLKKQFSISDPSGVQASASTFVGAPSESRATETTVKRNVRIMSTSADELTEETQSRVRQPVRRLKCLI